MVKGLDKIHLNTTLGTGMEQNTIIDLLGCCPRESLFYPSHVTPKKLSFSIPPLPRLLCYSKVIELNKWEILLTNLSP